MELQQAKSNHLEKLSSSLNSLRETESNCDFTIEVGEQSFPVHRNVLIAASDYFRAMLSHDTKERQDGVVEMMEIEPDAVKFCIEFMYTGTTTVTMETVEYLLPVAEIMQLNALSKICVEILKKNLESENCISVLNLARTYNCTDLEEEALELFRKNFKFEGFGDFAELGKEDLVQRISDCELENELTWEVIINWIKNNVVERSKYVFELVKLLDWECFPSADVLTKMWRESIVQESKQCQYLIIRRVFRSTVELKNSINLKNCFIINQISSCNDFSTTEAENVITEFMSKNMLVLCQRNEFENLDEKLILNFFKNKDFCCFQDANSRWNAMMKWIKFDLERKKFLPELFRNIRFDQLSNDFLRENVRSDVHLLGIPDFYQTFFEATTSSDVDTEERRYIAVLYPDGKVFAMDMLEKNWKVLPDVEVKSFNQMFHFRAKLCVMNNNVLFSLSRDGRSWIEVSEVDRMPGRNTKVVTNDRYICLVENTWMEIFDNRTGEWTEFFYHDLGTNFMAAATDSRIYVRGFTGKARFFHFSDFKCSQEIRARPTTEFSSMAGFRNNIYVLGLPDSYGSNCSIKCLDHIAGWKTLSTLPLGIDRKSWAFFAGEKLMFAVSNGFYIYNELCDSWSKFTDLPPYKSGLGHVNNLEPLSICSFKGTLDKLKAVNMP